MREASIKLQEEMLAKIRAATDLEARTKEAEGNAVKERARAQEAQEHFNAYRSRLENQLARSKEDAAEQAQLVERLKNYTSAKELNEQATASAVAQAAMRAETAHKLKMQETLQQLEEKTKESQRLIDAVQKLQQTAEEAEKRAESWRRAASVKTKQRNVDGAVSKEAESDVDSLLDFGAEGGGDQEDMVVGEDAADIPRNAERARHAAMQAMDNLCDCDTATTILLHRLTGQAAESGNEDVAEAAKQMKTALARRRQQREFVAANFTARIKELAVGKPMVDVKVGTTRRWNEATAIRANTRDATMAAKRQQGGADDDDDENVDADDGHVVHREQGFHDRGLRLTNENGSDDQQPGNARVESQ